MKIALFALLFFIFNLPFGYWRQKAKNFSWQFFLTIFLPIVTSFMILFCQARTDPLTVYLMIAACYILGQYVGARIRVRSAAAASPEPFMVPPMYFMAAIVLMLCLNFAVPVGVLNEPGLQSIGLFLFAAGFGLVVAIARSFRRNNTALKPGEVSSLLITTGLYRYSRNPIYTAMILALCGVAMLIGTITPWLIIPLFILVISRDVIAVEEKMLQETFGKEYTEYCSAVRRWI